jgi:hypothetical protein
LDDDLQKRAERAGITVAQDAPEKKKRGARSKLTWTMLLLCMVRMGSSPAQAFTAYDCFNSSNIVKLYSLLEPNACTASDGKQRDGDSGPWGYSTDGTRQNHSDIPVPGDRDYRVSVLWATGPQQGLLDAYGLGKHCRSRLGNARKREPMARLCSAATQFRQLLGQPSPTPYSSVGTWMTGATVRPVREDQFSQKQDAGRAGCTRTV